MYDERLAYDAALRQYVVDIAEFEKWLAKHREAQCRATEIEPQLTCLPALQAELVAAATYEQRDEAGGEQPGARSEQGQDLASRLRSLR